MEAQLTEDLEGNVEQLLAPPGGRQSGRVRPGLHVGSVGPADQQESGCCAWKPSTVRPPKQTPASTARRPPEPFRPLPARKLGTSLLSVQARRRRYTNSLPPRAGESGGW